MRQLLPVLPEASDVITDRNVVGYHLSERYPATATILALNRSLERDACEMAKADPFGSETVMPFNKWMEYTPEPGKRPELLWTGAWRCNPNGEVVVFAFRTARQIPGEPTPPFAVKAAYYSADVVSAMRRHLTGTGNHSLSFDIEGQRARREVSYETCSICGSVRKKENDNDWIVEYNAPSDPHEHHWERGVSAGAKVSDDQVILARRRVDLDSPTYAYGAFVLENQRFEPHERTDVRWIVRTDGGSVLDPRSPAVKTGSANDKSRIEFGPFSVQWSNAGSKAGFMYYARFPGGGGFSDDYELALTDLKSFDGVDAADPRYKYRFFPLSRGEQTTSARQ
jgi:hypothetical protein